MEWPCICMLVYASMDVSVSIHMHVWPCFCVLVCLWYMCLCEGRGLYCVSMNMYVERSERSHT